MKKFVGYVLETAVICTIMIIAIFYGIVGYPQNTFETSYQSAIQDKFCVLKETDAPKIIIVGGSNGAFGIDQNMLEEATGYKVANLGLHAGFGQLFPTELSKANINPGDIVLLAYEYSWYDEEQFTTITGPDLVMSGIDSDVELYKYIPLRAWPSILGYLGQYAYKKNTFEPESGQYSREAFDRETGQMVYSRDYNMNLYHDEYKDMQYGFSNVYISNESIKYLKEYKAFVEKKGAQVYFVAPPLLREIVVGDLGNIKDLEEELIGIPYISNPIEYLYPETLMSNAIYHCNDRGEKERTRQLINDLHNAGVIDIKNIEEYQREKDNKIVFEYDLSTYLEEIDDAQYTVFISVKNEDNDVLPEEVKEKLRRLGLKTDLIEDECNSYCAVISRDGIIENAGDKELKINGMIADTEVAYSIVSAGGDCSDISSIMIEDVEYSRNLRGLNIVVYDHERAEVIDAVCFDVFDGVSVNR